MWLSPGSCQLNTQEGWACCQCLCSSGSLQITSRLKRRINNLLQTSHLYNVVPVYICGLFISVTQTLCMYLDEFWFVPWLGIGPSINLFMWLSNTFLVMIWICILYVLYWVLFTVRGSWNVIRMVKSRQLCWKGGNIYASTVYITHEGQWATENFSMIV